MKYNASASQIKLWLKVARTQGYDALAITRPRGRPPKNAMGRPRKKKPEEMTELERLRYENECLRAENALLKKVKDSSGEDRDGQIHILLPYEKDVRT